MLRNTKSVFTIGRWRKSTPEDLAGSENVDRRAPTKPKSADSTTKRQPLASLQTYPSFSDHDSSLPSDVSKTPEITKTPPKPTPSPRSKPLRPRRGSDGSSSTSTKRLEKPFILQRSNSQPRLPYGHDHPRGRSYSSSSAVSNASTSSTSKQDSIKSLLANLERRRHKYGDTHPKVGSAWNRIGKFFFRACQYSRALDAFKRAVMCYPVGESELACSYANIGAVHWATGNPDKAITFLEKALEIYELNEITEGRDPEESMTVASTLYQMGLCYTLLKQYGEALTCLKKCQKIQASILPPRDIQVGRTLDAIGKVHFFKEEYSTALQCHEEARRIKSASEEDDSSVITSLLNIAAVHHATRHWNVALKNYTKVLDLQKSELARCRNRKGQPLLARAAQEVGETMQLMGDLHHLMDQADEAERCYKEASSVYEEAGLPADDPRMKALK